MNVAEYDKKVFIHKLKSNEILTRDLLGPHGQLILPKGTVLTPTQITHMRLFGVTELWVKVDQTEELPLENVNLETVHAYRETITTVENLFESAKQNRIVDLEASRCSLQELATSLSSETNFLRLVTNLRTYDEYTYQHSIGVGMLSRQIAEWMGLPDAQCQDLFLAATLHDIGKCRIDESILNKPGRLTPEEYEQIKHHAYDGYEILVNSGLPEQLAAPAFNHHERMNGSGYPRGLTGAELDLFSRIVAVADVFNAMTSRRVYRNPVSYYKVLDELQQNSFGELDPRIVSLFVHKMTTFLVGNRVTLSDDREGTVVFVPVDRPTRPLVQSDTEFMDLMQRPELYIESVETV